MVALVYESLGMHFVSVGNCALVRTEQGALSQRSLEIFNYQFLETSRDLKN